MPTDTPIEEIKDYYDAHVFRKIEDFVEGNARVEYAWQTLLNWAPKNPMRILEIGCGIGAISWRMSQRWPYAEVIGSDISPRSIDIAKRLFVSPKLSYCEGFATDIFSKPFDLIVLMDVYEHIACLERQEFHQALRTLKTDSGRIFLSLPTPRKQIHLAEYDPSGLQPIDEQVTIEDIIGLANDSRSEVLLYQQVSVWKEGDYAHVVLGNYNICTPVRKKREGRRAKIKRLVNELIMPDYLSISQAKQRATLVKNAIRSDYRSE